MPIRIVFLVALTIAFAGCSTIQPPDPNGPATNESTYPLLYSAGEVRRNTISNILSYFVMPVNAITGPELQPVTLTVKNLGPPQGRPLYLPKLGTAAVMTEDETRESLRRFIREWQELIGTDPTKLSLVARVDQPDGTKLATYEQRPFRYPIRGPFGKLEIRFANDRRVLNIASTCIPNADRIQKEAVALGLTAKLKPGDAVNQIVNNNSSADNRLSLTLQASQLTARELVIYVRQSTTNTEAIEFHLAWEVAVRNAPVQNVYVDAVNGEVIASE